VPSGVETDSTDPIVDRCIVSVRPIHLQLGAMSHSRLDLAPGLDRLAQTPEALDRWSWASRNNGQNQNPTDLAAVFRSSQGPVGLPTPNAIFR
jgi:hypothetical protein